MLHDGVTSRSAATSITIDRREAPRQIFPAELTLTWLHDPRTPVRFRVTDIGEGGFRIMTSSPLLEGMTGIAWKLLPEGRPIRRTVVVAWVRQSADQQHEAGLRFL